MECPTYLPIQDAQSVFDAARHAYYHRRTYPPIQDSLSVVDAARHAYYHRRTYPPIQDALSVVDAAKTCTLPSKNISTHTEGTVRS